jgi:glycine/D-amino acid oxidase-like deaminating enzyme
VNGLFRHGFLLAPALAALLCDYLTNGVIDNHIFELS